MALQAQVADTHGKLVEEITAWMDRLAEDLNGDDYDTAAVVCDGERSGLSLALVASNAEHELAFNLDFVTRPAKNSAHTCFELRLHVRRSHGMLDRFPLELPEHLSRIAFTSKGDLSAAQVAAALIADMKAVEPADIVTHLDKTLMP